MKKLIFVISVFLSSISCFVIQPNTEDLIMEQRAILSYFHEKCPFGQVWKLGRCRFELSTGSSFDPILLLQLINKKRKQQQQRLQEAQWTIPRIQDSLNRKIPAAAEIHTTTTPITVENETILTALEIDTTTEFLEFDDNREPEVTTLEIDDLTENVTDLDFVTEINVL